MPPFPPGRSPTPAFSATARHAAVLPPRLPAGAVSLVAGRCPVAVAARCPRPVCGSTFERLACGFPITLLHPGGQSTPASVCAPTLTFHHHLPIVSSHSLRPSAGPSNARAHAQAAHPVVQSPRRDLAYTAPPFRPRSGSRRTYNALARVSFPTRSPIALQPLLSTRLKTEPLMSDAPQLTKRCSAPSRRASSLSHRPPFHRTSVLFPSSFTSSPLSDSPTRPGLPHRCLSCRCIASIPQSVSHLDHCVRLPHRLSTPTAPRALRTQMRGASASLRSSPPALSRQTYLTFISPSSRPFLLLPFGRQRSSAKLPLIFPNEMPIFDVRVCSFLNCPVFLTNCRFRAYLDFRPQRAITSFEP